MKANVLFVAKPHTCSVSSSARARLRPSALCASSFAAASDAALLCAAASCSSSSETRDRSCSASQDAESRSA